MIFQVTHRINHTILVLWFLNGSMWWQEGTIGRELARPCIHMKVRVSSRPISITWADALQTPDCSPLLQMSWLALYIRLQCSPPKETHASYFSATLCSLQMLYSAPVFSRKSPSCFYHTLSLVLMCFYLCASSNFQRGHTPAFFRAGCFTKVFFSPSLWLALLCIQF